jgi:hypothetical protein
MALLQIESMAARLTGISFIAETSLINSHSQRLNTFHQAISSGIALYKLDTCTLEVKELI